MKSAGQILQILYLPVIYYLMYYNRTVCFYFTNIFVEYGMQRIKMNTSYSHGFEDVI